ncbi:MAG: hypothetical protein JKY66_06930 [Spongiibacteraceae bacterium]|nr:hypothetical protein [Spongiibacteraceae bacterium]MBN4055209.1 hypothetical protein [bacterium AH-315-K03]
MRKWFPVFLVFFTFPITSLAWHSEGKVYCDANANRMIDSTDPGIENVDVLTTNSTGGVFTDTTNSDGTYYQTLPDMDDTYTKTLDPSTLPSDANIVLPAGEQYDFGLTLAAHWVERNWLINSRICRPAVCWLTAGGVKFSAITGTLTAEKGPHHNLGGNVFPSCNPAPGNGGQWNHVAHKLKLHFLGKDIHTVSCGNVPGIEPGSESPVTPYNYIEFEGTGTLKGIKGNKVDHGMVYFFARAEDRNEPGSHGAKAGEDVDRYMIHVFADPADPAGTTLMLLDQDMNPLTIDPITITGGNFQMHVSSCDDPPTLAP